MKTHIFVAAILSTQLGFVGCGDDPGPGVKSAESTALEEAREVEADKYAPGVYSSAVERDDERLARRALSEAIELRNEARRTAQDKLRDAEVLLDLVEKLKSQEDFGPRGLPSAEEISKLRDELARARQAFQENDFPTAGVVAQLVVQRLGGPRS